MAKGEKTAILSFLLMIAVFLLIIAVGVDLTGLYLRKYRRDPEPANLYNNYKDKSTDETRKILTAHYISCFEENKKRIKNLSNLYKIAVTFTATSIFIIFIYLVKGELLKWLMTIINLAR